MASAAQPLDPPLRAAYETPHGLIGSLTVVNHRTVGMRFMVTALVFFGLGGVIALIMRLQLAHAESGLLSPEAYNSLFTMHGTTMMFFFAVPFVEGMANYLVPLMLGARDLPFPRFNAFNYWLYLFGGLFLYSSFFLAAVPDGGWFAYVPLTSGTFSPGINMDLWLVGVTLAEISAIGAATEFIAAIFKLRAPGMSLDRMPVFVWAVLAASFMIVFAFTPLLMGSLFLEADRFLGTGFFSPELGGSALLWQHLFWIFGHPEVYVMFLPAAGIASQIVQASTGTSLVGYTLVVASIVGVGFLSLGLWVHHMFAVGLPLAPLALFSAASLAIGIPNGIQVTAWIATIWKGRPRMTSAMWFVVGFVLIFVLGGFTGIMVAVAPFDWQAHDTYFVVAHFHYVLIGGVVFPIVAALYHWFPKVTGRFLDERLGVASFWFTFVGFNVTFLPMHFAGLYGMPRRVYTYPEGAGWDGLNLTSTIGAFVLATGFVLTLVNIVRAMRTRAAAPPDPWGGDTLEWSTASPPPPENFARIPFVTGRHPVWNPAPERDDREWAATDADDLASRPTSFRTTLATTPVDARPVELVHLPGPTLVPLVAATGVAALSLAVLAKAPAAAIAGTAILLVGLGWWVYDNERERRLALARIGDVAGLHVNVSGPGGVGWWGFLVFLVVAVVAFGTAVATYFYLWFSNDEWPPLRSVGFPPSPLLAALAAALVAASALLAAVGTEARARRSLAIHGGAFALGLAGLVLWIVDWFRVPFTPTTDAQGSAFFAVVATGALLFAVALAFAAIVLVALVRRVDDARTWQLLENSRLLWYVAAATVVVAFVAVYLLPRW